MMPERCFEQICLLLFAVMAMCAPAISQPAVINAKVVDVASGDTIVIRDYRNEQHKVRLEGIEAPAPADNLGQRARAYLSALVNGKYVRIVSIKYDLSGMLVGKVLLKRRDICLEMVIAGFARHFSGFAHKQSPEDFLLFEAAEKNAKRAKFNIWAP